MSFFIAVFGILTAGFFESSFVFLPLTTLFIILLSIYEEKTERVLFLTIIGGLFLDILQVRSLGTTPAFFLVVVTFIFLYKRKLSQKNPVFVSLTVFLVSLFYLLVFSQGTSLALVQAFVLTFLTLAFLFLKLFLAKEALPKSV